jgi:hypothetical protein
MTDLAEPDVLAGEGDERNPEQLEPRRRLRRQHRSVLAVWADAVRGVALRLDLVRAAN